MKFDRAWTSTFPGTVNGVTMAAKWIEALSAAERLPEDLTFGIQICVEELFTNTVRHGGGEWPGSAAGTAAGATLVTITVTLARAKDTVTVVLEDDAPPFDVTAATYKPVDRQLDEVRPGGLGILLIRKFSSELAYDHVGGKNRTTMKFPWPGSELSLV